MEDGARTLREQRAAYVGMQEWTSEDVKRGGTAGFLKSVPAIIRLPGCFLTERFGAFYVLLLFELALSAERKTGFSRCRFRKRLQAAELKKHTLFKKK